MSAPIPATELAEMEVDAARGDLKAVDGIRLLAEVRRLRDYLREKNEIIKAYAGPSGMTPEDVAAALHDQPEYHVIEFREDGWTIKHPLACRPDLFACKVNRVAEKKLVNPPYDLGRFRCELDSLGRFVIGEAVG